MTVPASPPAPDLHRSDTDLSAPGRKNHSVASAIRQFFLVWYATLAGIVLWAVHLVAVASLVQLSCNDPSTEWLTHAATVILLGATIVAIVLSVRLVRLGRAGVAPDSQPDTDAGSAPGSRYLFLGRFGILVGSISALLIVMEEVYAVVLHGTTCA